MNEYTKEYLDVISQNDFQKKIVDLILTELSDDELLDELMKILKEESDD